MPLVYFWGGKSKFLKLCRKLDLNIIEHEICDYCHKPIYGTWGMGDKGNRCFSCELDKENAKS